jgi:hypothetical protein
VGAAPARRAQSACLHAGQYPGRRGTEPGTHAYRLSGRGAVP